MDRPEPQSIKPSPVLESQLALQRDATMLAALVAAGGAPFPNGLPRRDRDRLAREVRRRRCARLMRFLAQAIAVDIARAAAKTE